MKYSIVFALALWFVATGAVAQDQEIVHLKVLSYNIHHGEGVDGRLDLQRIADVIQSVDPDFVALQEVDKQVKRSASVDQSAELARLTKLHAVFGGNIELQGGNYGNAVLSRFPIVAHENHRLPNVNGGEQRGVLSALVKLPGSTQPLRLLATHFDHRADDRQRIASAKRINELAREHAGEPVILAGDLNDLIGSETLNELQTSWQCVNETPLPTTPVARPTRQIDFILYCPTDQWDVIQTRVLDEAVASDHRAILTELELLSTQVSRGEQ